MSKKSLIFLNKTQDVSGKYVGIIEAYRDDVTDPLLPEYWTIFSLSSDYGVTFSFKDSASYNADTTSYNTTISKINISETGKYISYTDGANLFYSTNFGVSFSIIITPTYGINNIKMSRNGNYMFVAGGNLYSRRISNYGTTIENIEVYGPQSTSLTGQYVISHSGGNLLGSSDFGSTFSTLAANLSYTNNVAQSDSGQYIYCGWNGNSSQMEKSTDFGATKTTVNLPITFFSVKISCSKDGKYVLIAGNYSNFAYSTDFGVSFSSLSPTSIYVSLSRNGKLIYALTTSTQLQKSNADYSTTLTTVYTPTYSEYRQLEVN